jgi:GNAT superfamily N-acetyltransferase
VIFRRLLGPDDPYWRPLMDLYARTFEVRQRETETGVLLNLTTPERPKPGGHLVLSAADPPSGVVGGAIFSYLPTVHCGYASYVFVDERRRSGGIGSAILREMERVLRVEAEAQGTAGVRGLFAEVQRERADDAATYTRFRFWRRNGILPLAVDWHYPPLQEGFAAVPSYLAFGSYCARSVTWYPAELEDVATAIFAATYAYLPAARQTLALILERLRSLTPDRPVPATPWPERHD